MGAHSAITADPITLEASFDAACARVNQWRGQLVETFARAEQVVTDTLLALDAAGIEAEGHRFPHLVGKRFERLTAMLAALPAQSGHVVAARDAMAGFRSHEQMRAMLCHGVTRVTIDRTGAWVAVMTLTEFRGASSRTSRLTIDECEAAERLGHVVADRRKLSAAMGQVRRQVDRDLCGAPA